MKKIYDFNGAQIQILKNPEGKVHGVVFRMQFMHKVSGSKYWIGKVFAAKTAIQGFKVIIHTIATALRFEEGKETPGWEIE